MGSSPLVLLVEGQTAGRESLADVLHKSGYEVKIVRTGADAQEWLAHSSPDLIIFDASTMRSNGIRNCRRLRRQAENLSLIHI